MDYWRETVECALEDAGIKVTNDQLKALVGDIEVAHENYGMMHGHDVASANLKADERDKLDKAKKALMYEEEKVPCPECEGKRAPTFNGQWEAARYQCWKCDRTGKIHPSKI